METKFDFGLRTVLRDKIKPDTSDSNLSYWHKMRQLSRVRSSRKIKISESEPRKK